MKNYHWGLIIAVVVAVGGYMYWKKHKAAEAAKAAADAAAAKPATK